MCCFTYSTSNAKPHTPFYSWIPKLSDPCLSITPPSPISVAFTFPFARFHPLHGSPDAHREESVKQCLRARFKGHWQPLLCEFQEHCHCSSALLGLGLLRQETILSRRADLWGKNCFRRTGRHEC